MSQWFSLLTPIVSTCLKLSQISMTGMRWYRGRHVKNINHAFPTWPMSWAKLYVSAISSTRSTPWPCMFGRYGPCDQDFWQALENKMRMTWDRGRGRNITNMTHAFSTWPMSWAKQRPKLFVRQRHLSSCMSLARQYTCFPFEIDCSASS